MAKEFMAAIELAGVGSQEPLHAIGRLALGVSLTR
jgi:hypothetical protein